MRNRFLSSFLFLFSFLFGTNVSGVISSNTTWSLANSPYLVTGNVLVNEGVTLSIEPGVIVKIEAARSILYHEFVTAYKHKSLALLNAYIVSAVSFATCCTDVPFV